MGCDYAIAETLRDLPTTGAVKKVSHRGMVEVPSHVLMFGGGLVFVNEKEVALGKQREELLRGATVYADLGNWCYAEVLDRFLVAGTGSGVGKNSGPSPFTKEMRGRIGILNIEHRADIIEATLARLRDRSKSKKGDRVACEQLRS